MKAFLKHQAGYKDVSESTIPALVQSPACVSRCMTATSCVAASSVEPHGSNKPPPPAGQMRIPKVFRVPATSDSDEKILPMGRPVPMAGSLSAHQELAQTALQMAPSAPAFAYEYRECCGADSDDAFSNEVTRMASPLFPKPVAMPAAPTIPTKPTNVPKPMNVPVQLAMASPVLQHATVEGRVVQPGAPITQNIMEHLSLMGLFREMPQQDPNMSCSTDQPANNSHMFSVRRNGNMRLFEFDASTMDTEGEQRGRPIAKLS